LEIARSVNYLLQGRDRDMTLQRRRSPSIRFVFRHDRIIVFQRQQRHHCVPPPAREDPRDFVCDFKVVRCRSSIISNYCIVVTLVVLFDVLDATHEIVLKWVALAAASLCPGTISSQKCDKST
jgi:hypothetical protein